MRVLFVLLTLILNLSCSDKGQNSQSVEEVNVSDTIFILDTVPVKLFSIDDIHIEKALTYDQHTLEDIYPYKDTTRVFQWDKIKKLLFVLDSIQQQPENWGILQNYKNFKGEAKLTKTFVRDEYKKVSDTLGVQRYQSVPLYNLSDSVTPILYGRDGSLIKYKNDTTNFLSFEVMGIEGEWMTEKKYIRNIADTITFTHAVFVDVLNQNITSLEKNDSVWYIRSMNPCTTGMHRPPYQQETPVGMYVLQEQKAKMFYLKDGTGDIGGFSPWASRFTNGAYVHGIPVNAPRTATIEYSASLGTTPRSHMCVRSATSHAKFIYDNFPVNATIIFVLE